MRRLIVNLAAGIVVLTLAGTAVVAVAPATLAGTSPQAPTGLVTVRVVGISRTNSQVQVDAILWRNPAVPVETGGRKVRIQPGQYLVGAAIPTTSHGSEVSQTLAVRRFTIRRSETIRLSSAGGKLLRVSVPGGVSETSLIAAACLGDSGARMPVTATGGGGEVVYVTPLATGNALFSYASQWTGAQGTTYQVAGSTRGGLPARPVFHVRSSDLARVRIEVRSNAEPADSWTLAVLPGSDPSCRYIYASLGWSFQPAPQAMTVYRTAGFWETDFYTYRNAGPSGFFYRDGTYRAGHSYLDLVGSAVVGPANNDPNNFPMLEGNFFTLLPDSLFSDPFLVGGQCCSRTTGTLALGGRVIRRWGNPTRRHSYFQTTLKRSGWYNLTLASRRVNPYEPEPAGILSPRVTLAWRFHATPPQRVWNDFPVTMTTFLPAGLDLANAAPASGTTTLRLNVIRATSPKYRLTKVRLMVSSNDGQTWQAVRVTAHHGFWRAMVPDPTSGFVSLRSVVTDAHGDSTTETIYRAYAVS